MNIGMNPSKILMLTDNAIMLQKLLKKPPEENGQQGIDEGIEFLQLKEKCASVRTKPKIPKIDKVVAHHNIIEQIISEEDELIKNHKLHIDNIMEKVKEEVSILQEISNPKSEIEDYLNNLEKF